jgi:hypothetical protein
MEQATLFGEVKSDEQIEWDKTHQVTDLNIKSETEYATILNFECDNERGYEFQTFKKFMSAIKVFDRKKKKDIFKVIETYFYKDKDLSGIVNDVELKNEEEIKDFIRNETEFQEHLKEQNKKGSYWDTRRYFWKKEGNNWIKDI